MYEQTFKTEIKRAVAELGGHYQNIETPVTSGVPDISICIDGVELWTEAKVYVNGGIHLRPAQRVWLYHRARVGGKPCIMAMDPVNKKFEIFHGWSGPHDRPKPLNHVKKRKYVVITDEPIVRVNSEFVADGIRAYLRLI